MSKVQDLGVTFLPIDEQVILAAASLPHHHSEPFDRMLIAQAIAETLPVLTEIASSASTPSRSSGNDPA